MATAWNGHRAGARREPASGGGAPEAWAALTTGEWAVSADSDRVGPRLTGPRLETAPATTVTGGYPVLAVVVTADLGVAAQLRPGDQVRFRTAL